MDITNSLYKNCLKDHAHLHNQITNNEEPPIIFTFPKHIFTEHLYITYHIYRSKQYITNIKILTIC